VYRKDWENDGKCRWVNIDDNMDIKTDFEINNSPEQYKPGHPIQAEVLYHETCMILVVSFRNYTSVIFHFSSNVEDK
jgi:hypothetical protein